LTSYIANKNTVDELITDNLYIENEQYILEDHEGNPFSVKAFIPSPWNDTIAILGQLDNYAADYCFMLFDKRPTLPPKAASVALADITPDFQVTAELDYDLTNWGQNGNTTLAVNLLVAARSPLSKITKTRVILSHYDDDGLVSETVISDWKQDSSSYFTSYQVDTSITNTGWYLFKTEYYMFSGLFGRSCVVLSLPLKTPLAVYPLLFVDTNHLPYDMTLDLDGKFQIFTYESTTSMVHLYEAAEVWNLFMIDYDQQTIWTTESTNEVEVSYEN